MRSRYEAHRIIISSIKVTILVWRVMGRAAISFFFPLNSSRCHQLMKLQPLRVLNRYSTMTIIQNPNEAGSIRYSGRVTTSPVTGSSSGCVPKRLAKYMKRNSTQPVQNSKPPNSPHSVWRVSPLANTPAMTISIPTAPMANAA